MIYLNRALDLFSTPIVTTVYYVLFTTSVLITSGILFHEWRLLTFIDITACMVGFSITTCGLILINYLKTNTLSNDIQSRNINGKKNNIIRLIENLFLCLDEPLFSLLTSNSQIESTKSQNSIPISTYANLLLDDNDLPITANSLNQSILLIDDCDLHS
jgi:hypothetical protein